MGDVFATRGGARIGWLNASFPFAKLTVSASEIELRVFLSGTYVFKPECVIEISQYVLIPFFGWGIQIHHTMGSYPARIIFWCLGNPEKLLERIRLAGFQASAPESAKPSRSGWAIRWQAAAIAVLVWNGLFLLDHYRTPAFSPGLFALLALGFLFALVAATLRVETVQRIVLKPGRDVGEVRPLLNLLMFVSGILLVVFAILVSSRLLR